MIGMRRSRHRSNGTADAALAGLQTAFPAGVAGLQLGATRCGVSWAFYRWDIGSGHQRRLTALPGLRCCGHQKGGDGASGAALERRAGSRHLTCTGRLGAASKAVVLATVIDPRRVPGWPHLARPATL